MYSVSQHPRDNRRRQYDIPTAALPKTLSPEVNEVLHMLQALQEPAKTQKPRADDH